MAGYSRNDTSNNIANGNIINATDLDGEFDAIQAAFVAATGHTHDGTAANGAPITKVGPTQDVIITGTSVTPKTDNTVDLGSSSFEFKDLYIDGVANIDSLVADTADINAGTIDGTSIGATTPSTGAFTSLSVSGAVNAGSVNATTLDLTNLEVTNIKAKDGTASASIADSTGVMTIASSVLTTTDINGGSIDGTAIGASSASTGAFTTLSASGNMTLSGGTANGVLYLNGSKVATSGSALTFDGTNLGLGTTATYQLQVQGLGQETANLTDAGNKGGSLYLRANGVGPGSGGAVLFGSTFGNQTPFAAIKGLVSDGGTNTIGDLAFSTRNAVADTALTERMRLTAEGNLGVGTASPYSVSTQGRNVTIYNNTSTATVADNASLFIQSDNRNSVLALSGNATSTNAVNFLTGGAVYSGVCGDSANSALFFRTGGANERMRIDGSGNILINYTSVQTLTNPVSGLSGTNIFQITGTTAYYMPSVIRHDASASPTGMIFAKSRGVPGTPATTQSGDQIGLLSFQGYDGTGYGRAAAITGYVGGTVSTGVVPGGLAFSTASAAGALTTRMTINSAGYVGINDSNPGYHLSVAGVAQATSFLFDATSQHLLYSVDASTIGFRVGASGPYYTLGTTGSNNMVLNNSSGGSVAFQISGVNRGYFGSAGGLTITRSDTGSEGGELQLARAADNAFAWAIDVYGSSNTTSNNLRFIDAVASQTRMVLDSSGNLGIGTNSPARRLDVVSTANGVATFKNSTAASFAEISVSSNDRDFAIGQRSSTNAGGDLAYLYSATATPIAFFNNATERMRLDASGNLGIGATSPGERLYVSSANGTVQIGATNGTISQRVGYCLSGVAYSGAATNHPYALLTNDLERMRITSAGDVGIGTSSPSYRLQSEVTFGSVSPSSLWRGAAFQSAYTRSDNSDVVVRRVATGATNYASFIQAEDAGLNTAFLALNPNGGNVGIGTTSPGAILHTVKTSAGAATVGAFLQNSDNTVGTEVRLAFAANTNLLSSDRYGWIGYVNAGGVNNGAMTFATTPGGTPATERMRIDQNGNLGIGTSSPSAYGKLNVNGNIVFGGPATRNQAISQGIGVWTTGDPSDDARASIGFNTVAGAASSSSYITFSTNNYGVSGGERMRLDSSGNLAVGATPSAAMPAGVNVPSLIYRTANAGRVISQTTSSTTSAGFVAAIDNYDSSFTNVNMVVGGSAQTGTTFGISNASLGLLQFVNTSNALIGTNGAQPLIFATTSAERLRITSDGNVGIGQTVPAYKLDVSGGIRATGGFAGTFTTTGTNVYGTTLTNGAQTANTMLTGPSYNFSGVGANEAWFYGDANNVNVGPYGAYAVKFITNGSERMRITSAGYVGIGTSSPGTNLEVVGQQANWRRFSSDTAPFYQATIKSRGAPGSPTTVALGDAICSYQFYAYNGTNEQQAAFITGRVSSSGTVSATSMPGTIDFGTTPDGSSAAVTRMTLDSSGNLGIGTISPRASLDNAGSRSAFGKDVGGYHWFRTNDNVTEPDCLAYGFESNGTSIQAHQWRTGGTERMRLDSSGNLIFSGTGQRIQGDFSNATVANRVMFQTSTGNSNTVVSAIPNGTASIAGLVVANASDPTNASYGNLQANSATEIAIRSDRYGTGTYLPMTFYTGGSERMQIDASGNVGIGTTSPSTYGKFVVWGGQSGTSTSSAAFSTPGSAQSEKADLALYSTFVGTGDSGPRRTADLIAGFTGSWGTEYLSFNVGNNGAANDTRVVTSEKMRLDSSGNLGIGTSSPSYKLDISAPNDSTARVRLLTTTGYNILWSSNNSGGTWVGTEGSAGGALMSGTPAWASVITSTVAAPLCFGINTTEQMRLTSGGDLLVGATTTPSSSNAGFVVAKDANGTYLRNACTITASRTHFEFVNGNGTVGTISTSASATAYNTSSDRRLKTNIAPAADAGALIDAIEVVQHDWKVGGHTRYGMIAQDLNSVAPEAVSAGDDGDEIEKTWGVDYSKLVPMLIKEIQSLRARVAALESQP